MQVATCDHIQNPKFSYLVFDSTSHGAHYAQSRTEKSEWNFISDRMSESAAKSKCFLSTFT